MPRNDGIRYGAGGAIMEIAETQPEPRKSSVTRGTRKKAEVLEEQIRDIAPIEFEEETDEKI